MEGTKKYSIFSCTSSLKEILDPPWCGNVSLTSFDYKIAICKRFKPFIPAIRIETTDKPKCYKMRTKESFRNSIQFFLV
jgi:hypothetical protein